MRYEICGPVAFFETANTAVSFSYPRPGNSYSGGTVLPIRKVQTELEVAIWGEENRFPQNIENEISYVGIAKSALDWKIRTLWGNGIMPGKVVDYTKEGDEIFEPLKPDTKKSKQVWKVFKDMRTKRFCLEYFQDWVYFSNCFPELIFSKDGKTITNMVHQESCDSRYKQMDDQGVIETVYLSKLWGAAKDQYAQFDPKKRIKGLQENPKTITEEFAGLIKKLDCIDMYDPLNSTKTISQKLNKSRKLSQLKSAILPVNYPSVNKTYYQVPVWDGARKGGWYQIAAKLPYVFMIMLEKAWKVRYHIEVPETYFEQKYGVEEWRSMQQKDKEEKKKDLLLEMGNFLTGTENSYKTLLTFFTLDPVTKQPMGQVKITSLKDESTIDKDILLSSAANFEILSSMNVHPTLFSASLGNAVRSGGSDIREARLNYTAGLRLERDVLLEPFNLIRDFNREVGGMDEWEEDLEFRIGDTVLTTLDTGRGTAKIVS